MLGLGAQRTLVAFSPFTSIVIDSPPMVGPEDRTTYFSTTVWFVQTALIPGRGCGEWTDDSTVKLPYCATSGVTTKSLKFSARNGVARPRGPTSECLGVKNKKTITPGVGAKCSGSAVRSHSHTGSCNSHGILKASSALVPHFTPLEPSTLVASTRTLSICEDMPEETM